MLKLLYLKLVYTLYYIGILLVRRYSKEKSRNSTISINFIKWNNKRIYKYVCKKKIDTNDVVILLPHCIQKYDCPYKITSDIENCKNCGLCKISNVLSLYKKYGVKAKVATGGTLARKFIKEEKPKLVIAVACERDLVSGIYDAFPMPVFGVFNKIVNGPCINTDLAMEEIEVLLQGLKNSTNI